MSRKENHLTLLQYAAATKVIHYGQNGKTEPIIGRGSKHQHMKNEYLQQIKIAVQNRKAAPAQSGTAHRNYEK